MTEVCIGITDGPGKRYVVTFDDYGIVCDSREDLDLVLEGYEKPGKLPKAKPFSIKLLRKNDRCLIWHGFGINTHLVGKPRLKWIDRDAA